MNHGYLLLSYQSPVQSKSKTVRSCFVTNARCWSDYARFINQDVSVFVIMTHTVDNGSHVLQTVRKLIRTRQFDADNDDHDVLGPLNHVSHMVPKDEERRTS